MTTGAPRGLQQLAARLGVATEFVDGLGRHVVVGADTLLAVCGALGAEVAGPDDANDELRRLDAAARRARPPVIVAWDGRLPRSPRLAAARAAGELSLLVGAETDPVALDHVLPPGLHRLDWSDHPTTVISAPTSSFQFAPGRRWGLSGQLAAMRTARSRSIGDLHDLRTAWHAMRVAGGDLLTLLPLLPTFNDVPAEPSPYSPVSRLFWNELVLDLGDAHRPTEAPARLDVTRAAAELRAAFAGTVPRAEVASGDELERYAAFRGAQARLGRDWRRWPAAARRGELTASDIDPDEERFHLVTQREAQRQMAALDDDGIALGLDLAVGSHPEGYDHWSRQDLFASTMSVGAPPDAGFPNGQGWGFPPVLPGASRAEGHQYFAASVAHHVQHAAMLRIDHVMALSRLYWIPDGMGLDEGTYVRYPRDELFAIVSLLSHEYQCEVVGENLGTVPADIETALVRHGIRGMHLAQFAAGASGTTQPPGRNEVSLIGTHDTPPLAGWMKGIDIDERVRLGLAPKQRAPVERRERRGAVRRLAETLGASPGDADELLDRLLEWLGRSPSPLVSIWFEDLWLEDRPVNIPGSGSGERPNWQRPMSRLVDEALEDPDVARRLHDLDAARALGSTDE